VHKYKLAFFPTLLTFHGERDTFRCIYFIIYFFNWKLGYIHNILVVCSLKEVCQLRTKEMLQTGEITSIIIFS